MWYLLKVRALSTNYVFFYCNSTSELVLFSWSHIYFSKYVGLFIYLYVFSWSYIYQVRVLASSSTSVCSVGAISTKYVGLFIYLYVGLHTLLSLWSLLGEKSLSLLNFTKYFAANFLCLILGKYIENTSVQS